MSTPPPSLTIPGMPFNMLGLDLPSLMQGRESLFPYILYGLLEDVHNMVQQLHGPGQNSISVVSWLPHGKAFVILKKDVFSRKFLPPYFRLLRWEEFLLLSHEWGFTVHEDHQAAVTYFVHPCFIRGQQLLLGHMTRNPSFRTAAASANTNENANLVIPSSSTNRNEDKVASLLLSCGGVTSTAKGSSNINHGILAHLRAQVGHQRTVSEQPHAIADTLDHSNTSNAKLNKDKNMFPKYQEKPNSKPPEGQGKSREQQDTSRGKDSFHSNKKRKMTKPSESSSSYASSTSSDGMESASSTDSNEVDRIISTAPPGFRLSLHHTNLQSKAKSTVDASQQSLCNLGQKHHFIDRLRHLLDIAEEGGYAHIISWQSHGKAFKVHDRDSFVTSLLPKILAATKYSTMQRALRRLGFTRVKGKPARGNENNDRDIGAYFHPDFTRDNRYRPETLRALNDAASDNRKSMFRPEKARRRRRSDPDCPPSSSSLSQPSDSSASDSRESKSNASEQSRSEDRFSLPTRTIQAAGDPNGSSGSRSSNSSSSSMSDEDESEPRSESERKLKSKHTAGDTRDYSGSMSSNSSSVSDGDDSETRSASQRKSETMNRDRENGHSSTTSSKSNEPAWTATERPGAQKPPSLKSGDSADTQRSERICPLAGDIFLIHANHDTGSATGSLFPWILHDVLDNHTLSRDENDSESSEAEKIVSWLPDGRAFTINRPALFETKIIPSFFSRIYMPSTLESDKEEDKPIRTLSDFKQLLSKWGFVKFTSGPQTGAYIHRCFVKDQRSQCKRMRCSGQPVSESSTPNREFLERLHAILRLATHHEQHRSIAQWNEDGTEFAIHEPSCFVSELLPSYFSTMTYACFESKLRRWGFVRRPTTISDRDSSSSTTRYYSHENFQAQKLPTTVQVNESMRSPNSLRADDNFLVKLRTMLNDAERHGQAFVVSWMPHGRAFCVHDRPYFVKNIMPLYFNSKFTSFRLALRNWGFLQFGNSESWDEGAYYHDLFRREDGESYNMEESDRLSQSVMKKAMPGWIPANAEPDFYARSNSAHSSDCNG